MIKYNFPEIPLVRGIMFNTILGAYIIFLQPWFNARTQAVMRQGIQHHFLGITLVFLLCADFIGYILKAPPMFSRLKRDLATFSDMAENMLFYIWIFHIVVTTLILMVFFTSFGLLKTYDLFSLVMIGMVIKELGILMLLLGGPETERKVQKGDVIREFIGDLCLIIFSAAAFTTTWGFFAFDMHIWTGEPITTIILLMAVTLIFGMFLLPLRGLFIIEEIATIKDGQGWYTFFVSLLITWAAVMKSIW